MIQGEAATAASLFDLSSAERRFVPVILVAEQQPLLLARVQRVAPASTGCGPL